MALTSGTRLGPYVILSPLGAGGMGEVYRARDTTLRRDVAVKILHERFARDHDRLARFTREAQTLAALNHPNIAHIHGVEVSAGVRALVMELVEGEDLSQRVRRGPVPLDEALPIARQIAEALEAAHAQGIVHRDLKPANVMVRADGTIKVLDFGLAKALVGNGAGGTSRDAAQAAAPTMTSPAMLTEVGVIAGTAAYMSPEQAKGRPVDKGSDIWAFGCVLFEMLTGTRAFEGEDALDTMAKVVKLEPQWDRLPGTTPPAVRLLLQRCLRKDPRQRLHDAADLRIEIEDALRAPTGSPPAGSAPAVTQYGPLARWRLALSASLALLVGAGIAGIAGWNLKPAPPLILPALVRLALPMPADQQLDLMYPAVAVSPNGAHLVYVAARRGLQQLYLRSMDRLESRALAGTEGATAAFFSPDSRWVGYFAEGKLKKIPVTGGASQIVCDAADAFGGSWSPNDQIYFSPGSSSGLWQVSAAGGAPRPFSTLQSGEIGHRWPQVLPGGQAVLFTSRTGPGSDEWRVQVQRVSNGERRVLAQGGTGAYVSTGHLVYVQIATGTLVAVAFDPVHLEVGTAAPVPVAEGVSIGEGAHYAVSGTGLLAYVAGRSSFADRTLVWVDRKGRVDPLPAPLRPYDLPRISPDGAQVAFMTYGAKFELWVHNLAQGTATRFLSEGSDQFPVWTPDGKRLTYRATRHGTRNIFWRTADGSGTEERLTTGEGSHMPSSWSPDGQVLLFTDASGGWDILALRLTDRKVQPFRRTPFSEIHAAFSPDGRWVAYRSDESGRQEIYVQPYPGPGGRSQISTNGGNQPVWHPNGQELFYRSGKTMMAVPVATQPVFKAGRPAPLFAGDYELGNTAPPNYDVSADGRFLMVQAPAEQDVAPTQINIVLNWFDELKRLVPTQ